MSSKEEFVENIKQWVICDNQINNCTLKYCEKKEYTPLTFNYIKDCLTKIIDNDDDIEYIMKYLKENREIKVFSDIRKNSENKTQL